MPDLWPDSERPSVTGGAWSESDRPVILMLLMILFAVFGVILTIDALKTLEAARYMGSAWLGIFISPTFILPALGLFFRNKIVKYYFLVLSAFTVVLGALMTGGSMTILGILMILVGIATIAYLLLSEDAKEYFE